MTTEDLPDRLHRRLREYIELGGDLPDVATVMAMREAEASAAIDRDSDFQTIHFETEEGQTP